jgi:hypothetical protein
MPPMRIELMTYRLQSDCAADCATGAYRWRYDGSRIRTYEDIVQLVSNQPL